MTTAGLLFMLVSWGLIIGLNVFCFRRLWQAGDSLASPDDEQGEEARDS